ACQPSDVVRHLPTAVEEKKAAPRSGEKHGAGESLRVHGLFAEPTACHELGIAAHEIVFSFKLDPVAREVKDGGAAARDGTLELRQLRVHFGSRRILQVENAESKPFQGGLDQ